MLNSEKEISFTPEPQPCPRGDAVPHFFASSLRYSENRNYLLCVLRNRGSMFCPLFLPLPHISKFFMWVPVTLFNHHV